MLEPRIWAQTDNDDGDDDDDDDHVYNRSTAIGCKWHCITTRQKLCAKTRWPNPVEALCRSNETCPGRLSEFNPAEDLPHLLVEARHAYSSFRIRSRTLVQVSFGTSALVFLESAETSSIQVGLGSVWHSFLGNQPFHRIDGVVHGQ